MTSSDLEKFLESARANAASDPNLLGGWLPVEPLALTWLKNAVGITEEQWRALQLQVASTDWDFSKRMAVFARRVGISRPNELARMIRCSRSLSAILQETGPRQRLGFSLEENDDYRRATNDVRRREATSGWRIAARGSLGIAPKAPGDLIERLRTAIQWESSRMSQALAQAALPEAKTFLPKFRRWIKQGHADAWPIGIMSLSPLTARELMAFLDNVGIESEAPSAGALTRHSGALLLARGQALLFVDPTLVENKQRWVLAQALAKLIESRQARSDLERGAWAGFISAEKNASEGRGDELSLALQIAVPGQQLKRLLSDIEAGRPLGQPQAVILNTWVQDSVEILGMPRWVIDMRLRLI